MSFGNVVADGVRWSSPSRLQVKVASDAGEEADKLEEVVDEVSHRTLELMQAIARLDESVSGQDAEPGAPRLTALEERKRQLMRRDLGDELRVAARVRPGADDAAAVTAVAGTKVAPEHVAPRAEWQRSASDSGVESDIPQRASEDAPATDDSKPPVSFMEKWLDRLDQDEKDLVDPITHANKVYATFLKELMDALALVAKAVKADKDDPNYILFNPAELRSALQKLLDKGPPLLASFESKEKAESFANRLGLPGLTVEQLDDGKWGVKVDLKPVKNILDSLPKKKDGKDKEVKWDTAKYNAWQSAKDSYSEQMQNVSKVLLDRLSRDNQKFDNELRMFTAVIDEFFRIMRMFLDRTPA